MNIEFSEFEFEQLPPQILYDILALRIEVFAIEQNCLYQDLDFKDQLARHFVGYDQQQLAAYGRVLFDPDKKALSIGRVITAKTYRGKGVGNLLMQQMMNFLNKKYSQQHVVISSQCYIQNFYQSFGFEPQGEPYLEDGIPHIKMVRN
jgi:ElaA protein